MRFEELSDGMFAVALEPSDRIERRPGEPATGLLGFITRRGAIRTTRSTGDPRTWRQRAQLLLENARQQLWDQGLLRNPEEERRAAEEAERGTFIVHLNDGRTRRFSELQGARSRLRPGAMAWAEAELLRGPATRAEFYRPNQAMPFQTLERQRETGAVVRSGSPGSEGILRAADFRRATEALEYAYRLERGKSARALELAEAWLVAEDAAQAAGRPQQADLARERKNLYAMNAGVHSQRSGRYTFASSGPNGELFRTIWPGETGTPLRILTVSKGQQASVVGISTDGILFDLGPTRLVEELPKSTRRALERYTERVVAAVQGPPKDPSEFQRARRDSDEKRGVQRARRVWRAR